MKSIITILVFFVFSISNAATISGKINFKGSVPKAEKIKMNADPKCVKIHSGKDVFSQQIVVNTNNTLQWVFVYVKSGLPAGKKYPTPKTPATLNQAGCMYTPHVAGIMVNQPLDILNSDATLHNVHALPKNSPQFNIAQPKQGMKMTKSFSKAETMVKIKCEVHTWMTSYFGVLDHPYYSVSEEKGNFEIKDLPAGEYEIVAWQEKLGEQTIKVKVGEKEAKSVDFTFESK
ncbi:MAG: hypothetical protein FJ218_10020 [Ignavibacteria bacterium]|nr:hypothetical protein [Ignavibacteria bacterium]